MNRFWPCAVSFCIPLVVSLEAAGQVMAPPRVWTGGAPPAAEEVFSLPFDALALERGGAPQVAVARSTEFSRCLVMSDGSAE